MNGRILVIDDEPSAHALLEGLLGRDGYAFAHASSAREAYEILEAQDIDLVLCDVVMPGTDGLEVCRVLKSHERWRTIPIMLITALASQDDMVLGLEAGADEFLGKPIDKVTLRARVRALLRIRQQYRDLSRRGPRALGALLHQRRDHLADAANLSARERQVLELLMLGRTKKEIGVVLGISTRTAKFHQTNLMTKLGAESRAGLLRLLLH